MEILSEVGRGGMGVVYRAVDTAIGRTLAIQVVRLFLDGFLFPIVNKLNDILWRALRAAPAPAPMRSRFAR